LGVVREATSKPDVLEGERIGGSGGREVENVRIRASSPGGFLLSRS